MAAQGRLAAKTFRDLLVWRKAHEFVLAIYRFTSAFPKHETYGLSQQMRRAAVPPTLPRDSADAARPTRYDSSTSLKVPLRRAATIRFWRAT
jgi:hypothetical protein